MEHTNDCVSDSRVIVALDFPSVQATMELVRQLDPTTCNLKVGKELFVRGGPRLVRRLVKLGFKVFLDLKFHDIPNTVAQAVKAAADLGVWMVNLHASGGSKMMKAARKALEGYPNPPKLIAVTVLTSMDQEGLLETGIPAGITPADQVLRLARLAQNSGMDGVVCSAQEATVLREEFGSDFLLVTPGIRPAGADVGDQARVLTPTKAIAAGADYLVVGRPITQAPDPLAALEAINEEVSIASGAVKFHNVCSN